MSQDIEEWVYKFYGQEQFTPGLERINRALLTLKPKLSQSKIVIIAGTNGKGETTHRLGSYLSQARFCAWTSPHITSITERFSSEDGPISEVELKALMLAAHETSRREKFELTYYEFLFYVFCLWASQRSPEFILLEVGLGGRLDAVNSFDADLVLLTSISRDHQEFLGSRYDLILKEKLGVLRSQGTLVSFLDLNYLRERARGECLRLNVKLVDLEELIQIPSYEFSLRNQFLAYAAFCLLKKLPIEVKKWTPSPVKLADRGEMIKGLNEWWLFGSHNVDGMRKLIQFLHSANYNPVDVPFNSVVTSFSKRNEKDLRVMLKMLKGAGLGQVLVTSFEHPKAYPREALREISSQEGLKFVENVSDHIQDWAHQKILVVGSYYFLGQLKPLLCTK